MEILKRKTKSWINKMKNGECNGADFLEKDEKLICYDGYNCKHITLPLLFLDSYGDNWDESERKNVYTAALVIDKNLNGYLIDIKFDGTYEIIGLFNELGIVIDENLMSEIFGGKRPYYVNLEKGNLSLRFFSEYEKYLNSKGLFKEAGREGMLTSHRIDIDVSVVRNYQNLI